mmetsp:Transcript_8536/g.23565  ORF Transcript_8536/g.23565 Transcript_8536/m.23565 type:complete len:150 (-) Transcript_8536:502-951(-)
MWRLCRCPGGRALRRRRPYPWSHRFPTWLDLSAHDSGSPPVSLGSEDGSLGDRSAASTGSTGAGYTDIVLHHPFASKFSSWNLASRIILMHWLSAARAHASSHSSLSSFFAAPSFARGIGVMDVGQDSIPRSMSQRTLPCFSWRFCGQR